VSDTHQDKLKFQTREEAGAAAIVAKNSYGGTKLKPYLCSDCELWHLTSDYSYGEY